MSLLLLLTGLEQPRTTPPAAGMGRGQDHRKLQDDEYMREILEDDLIILAVLRQLQDK